MINNNKRLSVYLGTVVNSVYKILPLYEEKNEGLDIYIESLLFELYGLDKAVYMNHSHKYVSLLSTLESVRLEIAKDESKQTVVRREVFKCINVVKNMIAILEEDE
jgi:hypothetical protein